MNKRAKFDEQLLRENETLRARLEESEAALDAIRTGSVDALVISSDEGEQIFIVQGAEHPYRVMVETMNEGAATMLEDGTILYANPRLAAMLGEPLETLIGSSILEYISPEDCILFEGSVEQSFRSPGRAEIHFHSNNQSTVPVLMSFSPTQVEGARALCLVATDLTEQKRNEEILAAERLARSILDQAAEAIIVCDIDGKIIRGNQAAYQVCAHNPNYKPFETALPLIYKKPAGDGRWFSLTSVLAGESFQGIEAEYSCSQGQNRFFLLSAAPLLKGEDKIIGCIITLTEMTERKQMEERLAFQAKLLERVHDAIIATDEQFVITAWNRAAEELYGWSASEAIGQVVGQLIHSEFNHQQQKEALRELDQTGYSHVEVVQYTRIGRRIVVEGDSIALRDAKGKITGYVSANRDITERKQAEDVIRSYSLQLERSNKELQDFAFIASHDLQEPLRKIEAFGSQIGARSQLDETERDYLRRMQDATRRMRNMIEDLLELSRVTTRGKSYEQVDLNEVAKTVVEDLDHRLHKSGGQVLLNPLPTIEADEMQMHQLLQNLVGNAVKYHRVDAPPVVEAGYREKSPGWIEIFVRDNGIGFDMGLLDQIFQPFRRLHGRNEYEGSGIGLAICRKIVERHGGRITAQSTPGEGSTFFVVLPVKQDRE